MRNGIKRFQGDTLAFIRVISVSVQEFKNVFRKSLCFRFSAKVQLTSWLAGSDGTEAKFNYSTQSRNWDVNAADIQRLSDENTGAKESPVHTIREIQVALIRFHSSWAVWGQPAFTLWTFTAPSTLINITGNMFLFVKSFNIALQSTHNLSRLYSLEKAPGNPRNTINGVATF